MVQYLAYAVAAILALSAVPLGSLLTAVKDRFQSVASARGDVSPVPAAGETVTLESAYRRILKATRKPETRAALGVAFLEAVETEIAT